MSFNQLTVWISCHTLRCSDPYLRPREALPRDPYAPRDPYEREALARDPLLREPVSREALLGDPLAREALAREPAPHDPYSAQVPMTRAPLLRNPYETAPAAAPVSDPEIIDYSHRQTGGLLQLPGRG